MAVIWIESQINEDETSAQVVTLEQAIREQVCPHGYFDIHDCPRCRPMDGRCVACGTVGDHYCPADVARN